MLPLMHRQLLVDHFNIDFVDYGKDNDFIVHESYLKS